ncbi:hypothetical protein [Oceanobacter sp. 3_MG-2023]|uniref:hypothetical protein n=1 Tax=Oceanobacter sp. 3_MG-2023 TaxID=3062622 RepID=UPI0027355A07|nr:hypothetical protein [Oceanobacter sp. 3_MG-2023]MDP2506716.1 hypothetical protein [Oceanobacter sp. 3_MG-2023]
MGILQGYRKSSLLLGDQLNNEPDGVRYALTGVFAGVMLGVHCWDLLINAVCLDAKEWLTGSVGVQ